MPHFSIKNRRPVLIAAVVALIAAILLLAFGGETVSALWKSKDLVLEWCRSNPAVLFAALVILPAFGFPVSALLILAGVAWGSNWQSCLTALAAMFLNMSWTHLAASGPARRHLIRILGPRWNRWRDVSDQNRLRMVVLLRVTPGIPLFVQNYVLGLLGVSYLPYILISVPLNGIFVLGFVLTGGAIFQGQIGMIATGCALIVTAILAVRLIRSRIQTQGVQ